MDAHDRRFTRRQLVTRLVVAVAAAFVMLALHDAVATAPHDDTSSAMSATQSGPLLTGGDEAAAVLLNKTASSSVDELAGECALAIICVVVLAGLGAVLVLRGRGREMVLWTLPRAHLVVSGPARSSHTSLSPLQRSCVLRC